MQGFTRKRGQTWTAYWTLVTRPPVSGSNTQKVGSVSSPKPSPT